MVSLSKAAYGFHTLDSLALGDTVIHKLNPITKTMTTLIYVVIVVSFHRYNVSGLVPFILYPVIMMSLSETPYRPLLVRMAIALPFCLFAGISNVILDREVYMMVGGLAVSYGFISLVSIVLKTLLTVMAVLILIATTPMADISRHLLHLSVPSILVLLVSMIYRYISVSIEETLGMYTAYKLRAPGQKGIKMKDMGSFVGQLLLRSMDRAERIYFAMKCRGYNGDHSYSPGDRVPPREWVYILLLTTVLVLFRVFNVSYLLGSIFS